MTKITERAGNRSGARRYLPEMAILLVAFLVRAWRLDYHSFWFDETVSLDWAEDGAAYIWENTFTLLKDKHPPGYYLLLHTWQNFLEILGLDQSDVALRLSGVLLGVLTVVGVLLLVRRTSGRPTALLAGALTALAPVLVWYSQELRMFQPATTALVWAAYALQRGWSGARFAARAGWWLAMIAAFTVALYSYLFSAFLLPAAGLTLVGLWLHAQWVRARLDAGDPDAGAVGARPLPSSNLRLLEGAASLLITGLIFLPLARNAWLVNASEGAPGVMFADFFANLVRQVQIFTLWRAPWAAESLLLATAFFALLAVIGLCIPWPRSSRAAPSHASPSPATITPPAHAAQDTDRLWLMLWIGTPLLIANVLLATSDTIFKEDRYFLFVAPFVLWAIARAVIVIGKWWPPAHWILGASSLLLLATALPVLWSPALLREDWRAAAQYVAAYQQRSPTLPGAVISHADYTRKALQWYLRPLLGATEAPVYFPYTGVIAPGAGEAIVAPPVRGLVAEGVATLWLVQSHLEGVDDGRAVQQWLNQNYPVVTEQFPAGIEVRGYALQHRYAELPALGSVATLVDAELAPNLHLRACEILTPELAAADERLHPPSGWVHVRLWWQATGPIDQDYFPSAQMIGPEGVWGDRLYRDGETLRRDPPTQWPAGTVVRDEVDINLNPVTPPGEYPIVVGLRDAAGEDVGDKVTCGRVRVVAP